MSEPEIDIKMNIVPPKMDDIKRRIAEILEDAKAKEKALSEFSNNAVEMSDAVALMLERAKATGKANLEELMTSEFASVGLAEATKLSETVNKYFAAFEVLPERLSKVFESVQAGSMSVEEGLKSVERFGMLLNQLDVSALESNASLLNFDLGNASALDEVLASWERLSKQAAQNASNAKALEESARAKANALLAEKDALDTTSAGYEKQANELLKSSMAYDAVGDSAAKQVAKFEAFKVKLTEALSGTTSAEGVQKVRTVFKDQEAALKQYADKNKKINKELEATDNERIERMRRAVEAAERAEEQAQKRAEAEEKRAEKALENAEKEEYAMQLVGKSKEELMRIIDELSEKQKEASAAGDNEAYKKYTSQLTITHNRLERVKTQTNMSRIAFMQQAQVAGQAGQAISTLADGFLNFGESLENGNVNLTGMVSSVQSLSAAFKGALGPLGWVLLAVEGISQAWNWYAKKQKEAEEADKKRQERIAKITNAYNEAAAAAEEYQEQQKREDGLNTLKTTFDRLNDAMRQGKEFAEETYKIELARKALNENEEQHKFTLKKNAIERDYIAGLITQEERDAKLDDLRLEQAKASRDNKFQRVNKKVDLANAAFIRADKNRERVEWTRDGIIREAGGKFDLSKEEAERLLAAYDSQEESVKSAREYGRKTGNWSTLKYAQTELQRLQAEIEEKLGYRYESVEDYDRKRQAYLARLDEAERALKTAKEAADAAKKNLDAAVSEKDLEMTAQDQNVRHVEELNKDAAETRRVRREAATRKEEEKRTRKEAERRAKLQEEALREGEYEGSLTKEARAIASGKGYAMLADNKLSQTEIKALIAAAQKNTENEAFISLIKDILQTALNNKNVTVQALGKFRKQLEKVNINNID